MWDLVPWPGIEPRPLALGVRSLSHWNTREVSGMFYMLEFVCCLVGKSIWLLKKNEGVEGGKEKGRERG